MNLVDLITSQLSGDVLGKLGGIVGGSEQQTKSATSAAVPALLQIFGKLASSPKGADQLAGAMGGLDLSMLGNLAGFLGGGNASGLGQVGGDLLGSLLGGGNLTKLVGAIASFVGSQPGMMQKLLTYLAPIVLGVVAKQLGGRPDASGVSRLFSEQAGNISSALPRGLSLADLGSIMPSSSGSVHGSGSQEPASAGMGWLLPLVAHAALGAGLYLWNQNKALQQAAVAVAERKVGPVTETVTDVIEQKGNTLVETVQDVITIDPKFLEAGKSATELFGGLTSVLRGVTDEETARAALPKLEGFAPILERLTAEAGSLPAEDKPAFGEVVGKNLGLLQKLIDAALAIPGVKDILGGVVTPMVEALTKLTK
jgi:hypothetical protein